MSSIEQVIEGLKIFAKYGGDISAEHDIIYAGPHRMRDEKISEDDAKKLVELGWSRSETIESWYKFV